MFLRSSSSRGNCASTQLAARFSIVLALLLWGCTGSFIGGETGDPGGGSGADAGPWADAGNPSGGDFADAAPGGCDEMDILFVVDDSLSMGEEQTNLAANFPQFIEVLEQRYGGNGRPIDYRVAVTTTGRTVNYSVALPGLDPVPVSAHGANGAFLDNPACGPPRRWLERGDSDVTDAFACQAQVGTGGPNLEMPLLAVELALVDRIADGTNAGFLRPNALLAIVILTDEDDCSRRDDNFVIGSNFSDICSNPAFDSVQRSIDVLDTVTGGRDRWAAAVIAGPGPGICHSDFGDAFEGRRLRQFVGGVGENAVFSSICQGDLASALDEALDTFGEACQGLPPIP